MIAAHAEALAAGSGIAVVDGRVVEALHVEARAGGSWRSPRRSRPAGDARARCFDSR